MPGFVCSSLYLWNYSFYCLCYLFAHGCCQGELHRAVFMFHSTVHGYLASKNPQGCKALLYMFPGYTRVLLSLSLGWRGHGDVDTSEWSGRGTDDCGYKLPLPGTGVEGGIWGLTRRSAWASAFPAVQVWVLVPQIYAMMPWSWAGLQQKIKVNFHKTEEHCLQWTKMSFFPLLTNEVRHVC